jgi:hypothetical protein
MARTRSRANGIARSAATDRVLRPRESLAIGGSPITLLTCVSQLSGRSFEQASKSRIYDTHFATQDDKKRWPIRGSD